MVPYRCGQPPARREALACGASDAHAGAGAAGAAAGAVRTATDRRASTSPLHPPSPHWVRFPLCRDMLGAVEARFGDLERCADPRGEVAKNFRVPGFRGTVSFITSMTKAFCSGELEWCLTYRTCF